MSIRISGTVVEVGTDKIINSIRFLKVLSDDGQILEIRGLTLPQARDGAQHFDERIVLRLEPLVRQLEPAS